MAQLYAVAGSKIYIGNAVNAKGLVTQADFTGATWDEIGGWAQAGSLGDTQEVISQALINEKRNRKLKGLLDGGTMENTFVPDGADPGQIKFRTAIDNCRPYQFKIEWGASCPLINVVTISQASPALITWTAHGLKAGDAVKFSSTGALPTGLTAGTTYYVITAGLTANSFQVSATPGGAAVNTTAAGSGTHTAEATPSGMTNLFFGLALPGARQGGAANAVQLRSWSIAVDSNIVEV